MYFFRANLREKLPLIIFIYTSILVIMQVYVLSSYLEMQTHYYYMWFNGFFISLLMMAIGGYLFYKRYTKDFNVISVSQYVATWISLGSLFNLVRTIHYIGSYRYELGEVLYSLLPAIMIIVTCLTYERGIYTEVDEKEKRLVDRIVLSFFTVSLCITIVTTYLTELAFYSNLEGGSGFISTGLNDFVFFLIIVLPLTILSWTRTNKRGLRFWFNIVYSGLFVGFILYDDISRVIGRSTNGPFESFIDLRYTQFILPVIVFFVFRLMNSYRVSR